MRPTILVLLNSCIYFSLPLIPVVSLCAMNALDVTQLPKGVGSACVVKYNIMFIPLIGMSPLTTQIDRADHVLAKCK